MRSCDKRKLLALGCLVGCALFATACAADGNRPLGQTEPMPSVLIAATDALSDADPHALTVRGTPDSEMSKAPDAATATFAPLVATAIAGESTVAEPDQEITSHTVQAGDTLTRIAQRYDITVRQLLDANDLPNPDLLEIGQVLALPRTPVEYTPGARLLPDSRLVRSIDGAAFDVAEFAASQPGPLHRMVVTMTEAGDLAGPQWSGSAIVERVSREYRVDARLLLVFLEYFAGLLSDADASNDAQLYPLRPPADPPDRRREGLYNQLSWLADRLNQGYYDWKYRSRTILDAPDGSRLLYEPSLNAGTVALQYALAQIRSADEWRADIGEDGLQSVYVELFGDPFAAEYQTVPPDLRQPALTLPFPPGVVWRFTGGFHGGWGNGSAWSAIDFAPPAAEAATAACYISSHPTTAVADGVIARLGEGLVVLDLDGDGNDGSGWSILYLHIVPHGALREGQPVEAGNILGYASCHGGFSTATHLHIARLYNGEWLPADCNRCPADRAVPPFVMSGWKVVGLGSQLYQGFMVRQEDNRSAVAEQGRFTDVNAISW